MPIRVNDRLVSWAPDIEPQALAQAERSSRLPFIAGHVALMPDAHFGLGATVGSVIPTNGAIIPAAVGVDIGCGMIATRLDLTSHDLPDDLGPLHSRIGRVVPAGVGQGRATATELRPHADTAAWQRWGSDLEKTAGKQLGSLGSGNHFVEVCLDEADRVWIVLHSGSRGVGNKLAQVHIDVAKGRMRDFFVQLEDPDLAYLVEGTPEFDDYIADMLWAQDYAMTNRSLMMSATVGAVSRFLDREVTEVDTINCHHNFTQREHHHGRDMWVTRKGAIKADMGDRGVIPGSMGTRSYIVSGAGNEASYCSCSHGAGRRMGRKAAARQLSVESLDAAMAGIAWNRSSALIDEHPLAYKDIDEVMENQKDLVSVEHTLHQILNYKGT